MPPKKTMAPSSYITIQMLRVKKIVFLDFVFFFLFFFYKLILLFHKYVSDSKDVYNV